MRKRKAVEDVTKEKLKYCTSVGYVPECMANDDVENDNVENHQ